jgi:putative DNA primase/helicase
MVGPAAEPAPFHASNQFPSFSDDALALRFSEVHRSDLRYTAVWCRWSMWNGQVWQTDETCHVFELARIVCRSAVVGQMDTNLANRVASASTVAAAELLARADRRHAAKVDQWDLDQWLLNTLAGTVDLRTGDLRPAKREDYCTKITSVAPSGESPKWASFLDRITGGNVQLQEYLQRVYGYCLTRPTSNCEVNNAG